MSRHQATFPCGDLILEGELVIPPGKADCPGVAVCHPHPLYGGDMYNHIVGEVCRQLESAGIASLRFNFRGTGRSSGSYAEGVGERDDLRAAISYLQSVAEIAGDRLGVAGYSFGAGIAVLTAVLDDRIRAFAAISLPPRMVELPSLVTCAKPKLFVSGSHDQFAPAEELQKLVESLAEPKRCLFVKGADHFWSSGVGEVAGEVARFFYETL